MMLLLCEHRRQKTFLFSARNDSSPSLQNPDYLPAILSVKPRLRKPASLQPAVQDGRGQSSCQPRFLAFLPLPLSVSPSCPCHSLSIHMNILSLFLHLSLSFREKMLFTEVLINEWQHPCLSLSSHTPPVYSSLKSR